MTAEPVPPAIIDGGMAAPGLLTWVMISKYADHLPLYRLEQIAARSQVPLARSTLADWVGRTGVALQPLVDRLAELLRERRVLHADETPVAQLDPGAGKTRRAYLWTWRSNDLDTGPPIVVFEYQISRTPRNMLIASWETGADILWWMITAATSTCSRNRASSNSLVGPMPGASYLICILPTRAPLHKQHASTLLRCTYWKHRQKNSSLKYAMNCGNSHSRS